MNTFQTIRLAFLLPLLAATASCGVPVASSAVPSAIAPAPAGAQVEVRVADRVATVVLEPGTATDALLAQLPVTGRLRDDFGQAAFLVLPRALDPGAATPAHEWTIGEVVYDPDSGALAFFHARDTEQSLPQGVVRLGVVASGLDVIADAGRGTSATILAAG